MNCLISDCFTISPRKPLNKASRNKSYLALSTPSLSALTAARYSILSLLRRSDWVYVRWPVKVPRATAWKWSGIIRLVLGFWETGVV